MNGQPLCKIKRSDFGFTCPPKKKDPVAEYIVSFAKAVKQSQGGLQTFAD